MADNLLGRLLSERYRIERELGEGGMAIVYLAEDVKHHRKVPVKVLRPELAALLEERMGDPQRALNLVLGFDEPSSLTYSIYMPPALAICIRTATRLGETARARDCRSRLNALGWSADELLPR